MGTSQVWAYHQAYDEYESAKWDLVQAAKRATGLPPEIRALVERVTQAERVLREGHDVVPGPPHLITASPKLSNSAG